MTQIGDMEYELRTALKQLWMEVSQNKKRFAPIRGQKTREGKSRSRRVFRQEKVRYSRKMPKLHFKDDQRYFSVTAVWPDSVH